jgi:hypothetical protein
MAIDTLSTLGSLFSSFPPYHVVRDSGTWGDWQVIAPFFAALPSAWQGSHLPQLLGGSGDLSLSLLCQPPKQTDWSLWIDRSTSSLFILLIPVPPYVRINNLKIMTQGHPLLPPPQMGNGGSPPAQFPLSSLSIPAGRLQYKWSQPPPSAPNWFFKIYEHYNPPVSIGHPLHDEE